MAKIILSVLALFYVLCPYDLFPDMILGLGWIDDVIILYLLWRFFYSRKQTEHKSNSHKQSRYQSFGSGKQYDFGDRPAADDPYTVLGIPADAPDDQIKTAYRRLANKYHPDKVLHLGQEVSELAEERFKAIQKAYEALVNK